MPARKSTRLREFDYANAGAYFVTVCLAPRLPLLGRVSDASLVLSPFGEIVAEGLTGVPTHHPGVDLDEWIVMPDHVHAVIVLRESRARQASPLRVVVGSFKSRVARQVNMCRGTPGETFWQRGFYDHVVRDEDDLHRCREYIRTNPIRWRPPS